MRRNRRRLVHVERDAILDVFLEALRCDLQAVVSNRQFQQNIVTIPIGGRTARQACFGLMRRNRSALNDSTAWVCNCSANVSCDLLCSKGEAREQWTGK